MRIGFALPQFGGPAHQVDQVAGFARWVEELGADSLWVGDRLLAPVHPSVGYGGGSAPIPATFRAGLDPFVLLTVAAAATSRVLLGTNVLNAPWYPPALLGRALTSIDLLSGGRLLLGFGVGWSPEEYLAAGVPMGERGARLDECLDALEAWWTTDPVSFSGKHWSVPATYVQLKSPQVPRPPIYLAGGAPVALERVARRGDGWLPVCRDSFSPAVLEPLSRIRLMAEGFGRDPQSIRVVLRVNSSGDATVSGIADVLARAESAGVEHAFVDLQYLAGSVDSVKLFAEGILSTVR
ncbi:MAG TPA: TIGR03619 family F420-dependent LLM class oxidoreductase [Pseudonocardiaceae bacterium]|nr:TIGR03619 family F420-dependent LLM class oxidoreductase [Pseudonocardiaceae bacterium]